VVNGAIVALGAATDAYIATLRTDATARSFRGVLRPLTEHFGADVPVGEIECVPLAAWFEGYWRDVKVSTWNTRARAVRLFFAFCCEQGWCAPGIASLIASRAARHCPPEEEFTARMAGLTGDARFRLRDRALWGVVFDGVAKVREVLALDVPDIDLATRSARTASGAISWTPATNSLLLALLDGRDSGPVFLAISDGGRSRLPYGRAATYLAKATAGAPGGPWTFRQLREGRARRYGAGPDANLPEPAGARDSAPEEMHDVIARGSAALRRLRGWTQERAAAEYRRHGLVAWRTSTVGSLEAGLRHPGVGEVILICSALDTTLYGLLLAADESGSREVRLGKGAVLTTAAIRSRLHPVTPPLPVAVTASPAASLFSDAERHAARKLGVDPAKVRRAAIGLWRRDFDAERDARAGGMEGLTLRSRQARRGIASRQMLAEIAGRLGMPRS
jgi:integrase